MTTAPVIKNIQVLRGVAALIVLLAHANLLVDKEMFDGLLVIGWSGVDFFFVLSGFIISFANYDLLGKGAYAGRYFIKRLRRIFPIYWVVTIATLTLNYGLSFFHKGMVNWLELNPTNIIKSLFLLPLPNQIIPVAWTLTYEMIFYTVFLFAFLSKRLIPIGFFIWIAALIASFLHLITPQGYLAPLLLFHLNLEFCFGCFITYLIKQTNISVNVKNGYFAVVIGLVMLSFSWVNARYEFFALTDYRFLVFGVPFFLIILGAIILENRAISWNNKLALLLGDASYSIYLTHYISLILIVFPLLKISFLNHYVVFILAVVMTTYIGVLTFRHIEKPLIAHHKSSSRLPALDDQHQPE